jgi:hypothetical protein
MVGRFSPEEKIDGSIPSDPLFLLRAFLKNPACLPIGNNVTVAILAQGTSSG